MFLLLFFSLFAADLTELSQTKEWRALLHFEGETSLVKSESFFLSKAKTAEEELKAAHEILLAPYQGEDRKDPQCRFPARADFVFTHFKIDPKLRRSCPYWKEWKDFLAVDEVSVIYASSYMSSPSSFFGHTFLKLKSKKSQGKELLDYGLDAAAITGSDTGVKFAVKGVFGFYPGRFSLMPYHFKVQDYVNLEGRDLWDFPLQLTDGQKTKLLHHLIELEDVDFPYFYFDQNCSYLILSFLQAIYPEAELVSKFWFSTIPIDTLKVLQKAGLIKEYKFRPSIVRTIENKWNLLSQAEKKQVLAPSLSDSARVLEVKMDLEYLKVTKGENRDKALYDLQLERAKLGRQETFEAAKTPKESILQEMGSSFIGITAGEDHVGLHIMPALKDTMTPSTFTKQSSIALLETEIESQKSQVYLRRLKLLSIESYPAYTTLFQNHSYEVGFYYRDEIGSPASKNLDLAFGYGFDVYQLQWQILAKAKALYQSDDWDLAAGLVGQILYQYKPWQFKYRIEYLYFEQRQEDYLSRISLGYQQKATQIRLNFENEKFLKDRFGVELVRYF